MTFYIHECGLESFGSLKKRSSVIKAIMQEQDEMMSKVEIGLFSSLILNDACTVTYLSLNKQPVIPSNCSMKLVWTTRGKFCYTWNMEHDDEPHTLRIDDKDDVTVGFFPFTKMK